MDRFGRVGILKHGYHVGRYMSGETVSVESKDGHLFITHNEVLVAPTPDATTPRTTSTWIEQPKPQAVPLTAAR